MCWPGTVSQQKEAQLMTSPKSRAVKAGAVAWIAGTFQFFIAELVAQSAWRTPYSWATNAISDLGAVHCGSTGTANPPPRYVCSPLHSVLNTSAITLGILLASGAILTGPAWGSGAASRVGRALLAAAGGGVVLAGLNPEDVNLNQHVLGAFLLFGAGSTGFVLAGLTRQGSPLGRLRALTLPLSITAVTATWLMFSHHTPVIGYGGMERAALYPLLCWTVIIGAYLLLATTRPRNSQHTQGAFPAGQPGREPAGHAPADSRVARLQPGSFTASRQEHPGRLPDGLDSPEMGAEPR
jgi:hypothetical membrane protein